MLPRVVLHNEASVDGRMDWLTVDVGQYYELTACWQADAILSGSNTLLTAYSPEEQIPEDKEVFEPPRRDPDDQRALLVVVTVEDDCATGICCARNHTGET